MEPQDRVPSLVCLREPSLAGVEGGVAVPHGHLTWNRAGARLDFARLFLGALFWGMYMRFDFCDERLDA
jgi:hypothetical protein